jgi:hypothetical protein
LIFAHEDPEFDDLVRIVSGERRLATGLVEKDYWVTHTLWCLHQSGFDVWFKGGTSLSKGFALIERFSEDLDLKIDPGSVRDLPTVSNWKSEGTRATSERRAYFERLAALIHAPGAEASLDGNVVDATWRSANIRITYPGRHLTTLGVMAPFVRLEVGSARVTPFVARDMTSFVHDKLIATGSDENFSDNRPKGVRCVHPIVTLLEKLDALHKRFSNEKFDPAAFVRHFEDAARIIRASDNLPPLMDHAGVHSLALDMNGQGGGQKQIGALPSSGDPAFTPMDLPRWKSIRAAHAAIGPMFWGERISVEEACATIRDWIAATFG